MKLIRTFPWALTFLVMLLAAGCAKTTVRERIDVARSGLSRPEKVLIYNFAVSPADIELNASPFAKLARGQTDQTAEELQLGREVADTLATELTLRIQKLGLNALRASPNMPVSPNSILVTGRFIKIDEGNRLRRNVIGLGLGQSSVDTAVAVMVPSAKGYQTLLTFDAHTDSGNMPGAAVMGPAGAAAGAGTAAVVGVNVASSAVKTHRSAAAEQARQTADEIIPRLAKYFAGQGWIDASLAN